MKNLIVITLLFSTLLLAMPIPASAAPALVPCGRADQQPPKGPDGKILPSVDLADYPDRQCTFTHLIILIIRVINYLISVAAIVAMYQVLLAGFNLITALGNAEKIQRGKQAVQQAIIGFGIVVLAFVFVNLLVNGIFATGRAEDIRPWWDVQCVYDITNTYTEGCAGSQ